MRPPKEIDYLRAVCEGWVGTPFCPNSAVKGAGVCCHKFCAAVYQEAEWLPVFAVPDGYPYGSEANTESPFVAWLDASSLFAKVEQMEPGDLILSKPSRLPWHLAIFIGDGWFAHVDIRQGVQVTNTFPAVWEKHIVSIYRPKELMGEL